MEKAITGYSVGVGCVENNEMQYMVTGVTAAAEVPGIYDWLKSLRSKLSR